MIEREPESLTMRLETLNALVKGYLDLMNALQAGGHDLRDVVTAGFFALGVATAQGGGQIPPGLLLKDMQPFNDGYMEGLTQVRKQ